MDCCIYQFNFTDYDCMKLIDLVNFVVVAASNFIGLLRLSNVVVARIKTFFEQRKKEDVEIPIDFSFGLKRIQV